MSTAKIESLQKLASTIIGDGKSPNLYFVCDGAAVVTITRDKRLAYEHWQRLSRRSPLQECALEDRKTGVICSVEPRDDNSTRLVVYDDYVEMAD